MPHELALIRHFLPCRSPLVIPETSLVKDHNLRKKSQALRHDCHSEAQSEMSVDFYHFLTTRGMYALIDRK
jgi:hypothetical protein